jgi:hypothetical protein
MIPLTAATPLAVPRSWGMDVRLVALAAALLGVTAAVLYYQQGLTLSHYDAKGHLVVARRILDSLRPGWWQIGAVWLPLPHLLNMLPVQIDWLYRTGLSAVVMSIASFSLTATTIWWWIRRATGSRVAAAAGTLLFATQPDVLYLQSTPMTEPLLMACTTLGVALIWRWVVEVMAAHDRARAAAVSPVDADADSDAERRIARLGRWAGIAFAAAVLTRYEAWPITAAALSISVLVMIAMGAPIVASFKRGFTIAIFPILAIIAFLMLSRATVGSWLVTGGFYIPDNPDYHRPFKSLGSVWWALRQLNGNLTVSIAAAAGVLCVIAALARRVHRPLLIAAALTASSALPAFAFYNGHPFRIRYMVTLTVAAAVAGGLGIGLLPRIARVAVAVLLAAVTIGETPPFPRTSPMLAEAQWDKPRSRERQNVTACLRAQYDGAPILASMGSLAHYMQETSHAGFNLRDYIHEGIGQIWTSSLEMGARHHAGWVLIEEQAEGGDELARLRDAKPAFLAGFTRICEGGGVALYKRNATAHHRAAD